MLPFDNRHKFASKIKQIYKAWLSNIDILIGYGLTYFESLKCIFEIDCIYINLSNVKNDKSSIHTQRPSVSESKNTIYHRSTTALKSILLP